MLSLAQWKDIRRVDHVDLGLTHPRVTVQAPGVPPLDGFDADVVACAAATNDVDRVGALGRILARAHTGYRAAPVPQRYLDAVAPLYDAARADMNTICGAVYHGTRLGELANLANGVPPAPKPVRVNVIYLAWRRDERASH